MARQLQGVRLIFWAQLLSAAFMNMWGFGLPFIGAGLFGLSMQTVDDMFRLAQILPAIAAIIASRGVFQLIDAPDYSASRFLLKLGVVLEVLFRFRIAARAYGIEFDYPAPFWISRHLLFAAVVCGVFFACAERLNSYGDSSRPRRLRIAGVSLAGAVIVSSFGIGYLSEVVDVDGIFFDFLDMGFDAAIAIWGFGALWGASKALKYMADGRCITCGYSLDGLPTSRCPECGTEFGDTDVSDGGNGETHALRAVDGQGEAIEGKGGQSPISGA